MSTLSACGGGGSGCDSASTPAAQPLSAAAVAGDALFHDKSLSASGQQSCATCHVKERAFAGDPVPAGPGGNPYQAVGTFYTAADGTPDLYQYNDLPALFAGNVNTAEVPYIAPAFAGGNAPTLNAQEIDDLVAFLCTLTDGYDPNNPSAYNVPTQCQPIATP